MFERRGVEEMHLVVGLGGDDEVGAAGAIVGVGHGGFHSTSCRNSSLALDHAGRQALLVHVAADRLESRPVRLETIGPKVLAEHAPRLLDMVDQPGQCEPQRVGVIEAFDREIARFAEGAVDAARHPRMGAMNVLAHHHRVHDREDAGAAVIVLLDVLVVGKQPGNARRAVEEARGDIEREQRIELAGVEHLFQRLPGGKKVEPDALRQIQRDQRRLDEAVEPAHEPVHVLGSHAVVVLQHAAHEHEPGRAPLRGADPPALEVLRRLDAGVGADIDAGVAEDLRERHRHRHERALAAALERRVGGERELRDLELLVVQHALERLARAQDPDVEIDAFGFHPTVDQRAGAIVVPAGERELEVRHQDVSKATCDGSFGICAPINESAPGSAATERGRSAIAGRAAGRTAVSPARARSGRRRHRAGRRSNDCTRGRY